MRLSLKRYYASSAFLQLAAQLARVDSPSNSVSPLPFQHLAARTAGSRGGGSERSSASISSSLRIDLTSRPHRPFWPPQLMRGWSHRWRGSRNQPRAVAVVPPARYRNFFGVGLCTAVSSRITVKMNTRLAGVSCADTAQAGVQAVISVRSSALLFWSGG